MEPLDGIYFIAFAITLVCCFARLRNEPSVRLILPLLSITLVTELVAVYLKIIDRNNLFLFHFLAPVEYALYALIFFYNYKTQAARRLALVSIPLFLVTSFIFSFYFEGVRNNNSFSVIMSSLMISIFSIIYYYELIWETPDADIRSKPLFWICIGLLFYNSGNLITIGSLNYLLHHYRTIAMQVYRVSYAFSFIFFGFLLMASFNSKKQTAG